MAIRLRTIEGVGLVALCAARSMPKEGDVYLDDAQHSALRDKFARDFNDMYDLGLVRNTPDEISEQEESNNPNRTWWDETYGKDTG